MKTSFTALIVLLCTLSGSSQAFNMVLEANWDDNTLPQSGGLAYNDCWGYNASNGTEVAILGTLQRVYFFNVTDPTDPEVIDSFTILNENGTTNSSIWRDFKTYQHYAYGSADQGTSGLLIFDLQYVPDSVVLVAQDRSFFMRSHNIWIDVAQGRLYTAGANTNSGGTTILDINTDPEDPVQLGAPTLPLGYIHDIHVINHIGYASHGSDQALNIYDFTNATNPVLILTLDDYPEPGYNHSAWLNASGTKLVFADETHGKSLKLVDPTLGNHQTTNYHLFKSQLLSNDPNSIAHNPFIKDDYCYVAYYHDGVQIFDISDTNNISRIAYYDTYENTNYSGYEGCWGVYPFLESGVIVASDISNGLFMLSLVEILPLEFLSFDATPGERDVTLQWKVTGPDDGEQFVVEYSKDGIGFDMLDKLSVVHHQRNYTFVHSDPGPGIHYYRITMRYRDGDQNPSVIRSVQFEPKALFSVRNTVVADRLHVDVGAPGEIRVIGTDGRLLYADTIERAERVEISLKGLPGGQYVVVFQSGSFQEAGVITKI